MQSELEEAEDPFSDADAEAQIEIVLQADPLLEVEGDVGQKHSSLAKLCTEEAVKGLPVRETPAPDPFAIKSGVNGVLAELRSMAEGGTSIDEEKDLDWIRNVDLHVHDAERFVAGSFNTHAPAWEALLEGSNRASSKTVLGIIQKGLKPSFVGTHEALDQKKKRVLAMLRKVVPKDELSKFLSGRLPHQIEFPNHKSAEENADFVWEQVSNNVTSGAVESYPKGKKPKVVNPLGVVFNPKGRLILDALYPNLFMKRFSFKYETLRDILVFLRKEGFMVTWDLKSGYFHVLVHPDFRQYFGFKVGEVYFHYRVVSFGFAQACYFFTLILQEPLLVLREHSVPVSGYIDDGFSADESKAKCIWVLVRILRLFTHLGAHFSLPKCQLEPLQVAAWLGFVVDSISETFSISEKKLAKIVGALQSVLQADVITARDLAEMAGKLVSVAPAVLSALLFVRPFFAAMKGKESWDVAFDSPDAVKETARLFLSKLPEWNGRRWYSYPVGLSSSSDASDVGYGGFVQLPGKEPLEVAGTFTSKEAELSSTARELLGILATLKSAVQESPDGLKFSTCLITTDNLGASHALNKLKSSSPDVNEVLQRFFALCCDHKIDIRATWKPREELEAEDLLSRQPDASDWEISQAELKEILHFFHVRICVDLFASDTWHTVANFVSLRYTPGCMAANALMQDWKALEPEGGFAWAFPPVRLINDTVCLLERFKVNAVLVVPKKEASNWWVKIHHWKLNLVAPRSGRLPGRKHLVALA